ncbi:MAG: NHL repeat-containing protein [Dokdonella sp.]
MQRPLALALALALGLTPLAGIAATIIVKSSGDAGNAATCTLRQAIVSMNTGSLAGTACVNSSAIGFHSNDIINFDAATFPNGGANTITLADTSTGVLSISDAQLTLDATANGQVTIQRPSGASNDFGIIDQSQPGGGSLTLNHLALTNGSGTAGGGIVNSYANGHLTLNNCTISGNQGGLGGGIESDGFLTLINTSVIGNSATQGGGIASRNTLTLVNSTVSGNSSFYGGGGIYIAGNLTLTNSTISGNSTVNDSGGGIYMLGGGITLKNSTISANQVPGNRQGGGIQNNSAQAPLVINSIIAGNVGPDLSGSGTIPAPGSSGNIIGSNPQLGALASNGGPTWTMLPLPGSPAIDALTCTNAPATDQRGIARPQGAQCDIGAVEATVAESTAPPMITKAFGAVAIPINSTTSLTFTLSNPNTGRSLTGVAFTDSLPAGMIVATPNGLTNTCGGTATAIAGSSSASVSGATLAGGASCTVTVGIKGTTLGVKNNSVQVTSTNGGIGNTSNATLTVGTLPPSITKIFGTPALPLNGSTSLTFTVTNPNAGESQTGVAFADSFPAGLEVATPNELTSTCGGTATAVAGASSASLSGATLAGGATCTVAVAVKGTTRGVKTNSVQVTSTTSGIGNTSTATLTVSLCTRNDTIYCEGFEAATVVTLYSGDISSARPWGVAVDASGNVSFADYATSTVKEILAAGGYTTVNTLGSGFSLPNGLALDASGNVFVADTYNNAVKKILPPAYTTVITLGSGFNHPAGVAVDASGNVFVADSNNNAVKEILAPGYTTINTLGSGFNLPTGVAVDASGNVFVADFLNNAVKKILAPGYTTVNTLSSGFYKPFGVALDTNGNVFVADTGNNAVKVIMADGGYTKIFTVSSEFANPRGVAVDAIGNVFVADDFNYAVKVIVAPAFPPYN